MVLVFTIKIVVYGFLNLGIVSKTEKIVYEYEITMKNGKTKDINLVVKDNCPVSLNERIKVQ
ncbi:MAG: DUF4139 domain-containing protein [Calditerrivibrio sp.]|nr:DUF4139 domain-containing protein [Calditerrivibrio sp.]